MSLVFVGVDFTGAEFIGEGWGTWFPALLLVLLSFSHEKFCGRSAGIVVDIVCPMQPAREQ